MEQRVGWTVGGGVEWMFAPDWSVIGEYNYMDFGTSTITTSMFGSGTISRLASNVSISDQELETVVSV